MIVYPARMPSRWGSRFEFPRGTWAELRLTCGSTGIALGKMKLRYFDHNATTPLAEVAQAAWLEASKTQWLNPSSPYRGAAAVRVRLDAGRASLAEQFGVVPERVVFTSGATEANNAVIRHWASNLPSEARVAINPMEHPSVLEAAKASLGARVDWLPVSETGQVDLDAVAERVQSGAVQAVSVMAANNETGVIQPWQAIARICREAGIPYHCDAAQWIGKMPLDGLSDCTYLTACAHKFGGPKAVGFLILPGAGDACRILCGGVQEGGHRAGTEDVAGIFAMLAALEGARVGAVDLRDAFVARVTEAIPGTRVVGWDAPRLWNTVSLLMPKHLSVRWIRALEKAGCLLSAGSACSTGKSTVSHVLLAMGIGEAAAGRVLRVSASASTEAADWVALSDAMVGAYETLNREADSSSSRVISID